MDERLDELDARVRRLNYDLYRIAFGREPGPLQVSYHAKDANGGCVINLVSNIPDKTDTE